MKTAEINASLQIVPLKGKRFKAEGGYYQLDRGHALYSPQLGYLTFKDSPELPYTPAGGKKTLQSILDAGGIVEYNSSIVWVNEI